MSQTNVSTFTNKCTDKWIRQASGMEKASASSLLMYLEDLCLEVGELLQDGRGILLSERIFSGACNLGCIGGQMGQSSLELMGVCPSLGAAAPLSLQYGYNPVDSGSVVWLQNFLWIKKWPFYVVRVLGDRCEKEGLLRRDLSPKPQHVCKVWPLTQEAEVEERCGRIRKRFFISLTGWHA